MRTRRSVLAGMGWAAAGRAAAPPRARRSWAELMEMAAVPGAAIGRIEKGRLAWSEYLGVRHAEEKQPVSALTAFAAASLTKPVAAALALQWADRGQLALERPVELDLQFAQSDRARRVTPAHILSHSTGFPNWRFRAGQALECAFEPGTAFGYSGEGYYLLQQLFEKKSGRGFAVMAAQEVLAPAGMKHSALQREDMAGGEFAAGHTRRGEVRPPYRPEPPADGKDVLPVNRSPNAAASLWTTLPDYAAFAIRAMERKDWLRPRTKVNRYLSWGLGWGLQQFGGEEWTWHWGDNPGFKNLVLCRPARRDGLIVFTNGDNGQAFYTRVAASVLGMELPALLWI